MTWRMPDQPEYPTDDDVDAGNVAEAEEPDPDADEEEIEPHGGTSDGDAERSSDPVVFTDEGDD